MRKNKKRSNSARAAACDRQSQETVRHVERRFDDPSELQKCYALPLSAPLSSSMPRSHHPPPVGGCR